MMAFKSGFQKSATETNIMLNLTQALKGKYYGAAILFWLGDPCKV